MIGAGVYTNIVLAYCCVFADQMKDISAMNEKCNRSSETESRLRRNEKSAGFLAPGLPKEMFAYACLDHCNRFRADCPAGSWTPIPCSWPKS